MERDNSCIESCVEELNQKTKLCSEREIKRNVRYSLVPPNSRKRLVSMVEREGVNVRAAADRLELNYSTAKSIIRLFRKTGRIENLKTSQAKGAYTLNSEGNPCYVDRDQSSDQVLPD